MADGAAADIRLSHGVHLYRRLNAGHQSHPLHGVHQGKGVHHRRQHAHVVSSGAFHAALNAHPATPNITRPDHNSHIHTELAHLAHPLGDIFCPPGINSEALRTGQRFSAQFEQNAVIFERIFHQVAPQIGHKIRKKGLFAGYNPQTGLFSFTQDESCSFFNSLSSHPTPSAQSAG